MEESRNRSRYRGRSVCYITTVGRSGMGQHVLYATHHSAEYRIGYSIMVTKGNPFSGIQWPGCVRDFQRV